MARSVVELHERSIVDVFLNPRSVAVIGASRNPLKGGNRILDNIISNNFKGKVYPINPNSEGKIFNLEFKKSVLDIEDDVDLAILYVPNRIIPRLLEECVEKGIKGAIIEASGFEEVGSKGMELRDQIAKITDNFSKLRIVGPNCMGVSRIDGSSQTDEKGGFFSGFVVFTKYKRGNVAIISQSGMMNGGYFTHVASKYPDLGFRYSCAVGNKMDMSELEFLEYFIEDPTVNVIAIYLESFKDPRKFIQLCRKAKTKPNKTIILVKGGITSQGQKASLSHTGSLSENSRLIDAVIKQASVLHAQSFEELFQYARTFSMIYNTGKKLPEKGGVSMVVGSGGAGTVTADLTFKSGLNFPILGEKAYKTLVDVFPDWMPPNKFALVDFWPATEKAMMNRVKVSEVRANVFETLLKEPEIEGLFTVIFCTKLLSLQYDYDLMIKTIKKSVKPVFVMLMGDQREMKRISRIFTKEDIPTFTDLSEMVKNFAVLVKESKFKTKLR